MREGAFHRFRGLFLASIIWLKGDFLLKNFALICIMIDGMLLIIQNTVEKWLSYIPSDNFWLSIWTSNIYLLSGSISHFFQEWFKAANYIIYCYGSIVLLLCLDTMIQITQILFKKQKQNPNYLHFREGVGFYPVGFSANTKQSHELWNSD